MTVITSSMTGHMFTFTIVADTDTPTSTTTDSMPIVVPAGMEACVEVIEVP